MKFRFTSETLAFALKIVCCTFLLNSDGKPKNLEIISKMQFQVFDWKLLKTLY